MTSAPLPPPLKRGDAIGVFCPAGPPRNMELLHQGLNLLRDAGFQVRIEGAVEPRPGEYLADTDAARAAAFHRLWADDEIRAVMPVRGGYGCLRLAPLLDAELLKSRRKWLVGFSDLTLPLNHIHELTGLVCLHGPMTASLPRCRPEDRELLFAYLTGNIPETIRLPGLEILRRGSADSGCGRLAGGNLATLCHALGTPWDTNWDGRILFLEDTGEYLYRLDRMLTQLAQAGRFTRLAGLLLGDFDAGSDDQTANLRLTEQVWQRVLELAPEHVPVWAGLPFGHRGRNMPLPIGMAARMDGTSGSLVLGTSLPGPTAFPQAQP